MTTKSVKMCRNGDGFFPPVNVVVNPRDIRSMDAFLDRVTQATRMGNAARKVCTPRKGHKIEDLTKLISGETYVAVGREAFKNLEYGNIRIRRPVVQHREIKIEPVKHSRILMSARCRKVALWESSGLKTIYVYRNGDDKQPSHKILLDRRTLLNMDKVLELVTERVKLESGAVFALCTMLGKEVNTTSELVNGEKYVAVGHGKRFKRTGYNDKHKTSPNNSPRRAKGKPRDNALEKKLLSSSKAEEKQKEKAASVENKTKNVEVKGKSLNTHNSSNKIQTSQPVESDSINTYEETSEQLPETSTDATHDANVERSHENVFKASGAKSEKAKQVEDDKEVKIEKPIDQVPAEEVLEDIVDQNPSQDEQQNEEPQEQVRLSSEENVNGEENATAVDKE
ncbi:doublecortin domain-containing protein 2-like [Dendronephthya gigantea]|uniref:doublecortin domain-containing protein 2-like n=1 Tax=Dendronephthya gigantea TaxID=151771 RepID=UPI001069D8D3|nr:doublecortin domain-containing protein 2-like [Dendronephthya gigantea]